MSRRRMPRMMRAPITTCDTASQGALWEDTLFGDRIGIKPSLEERLEAGWSVGARADDVGKPLPTSLAPTEFDGLFLD